MQPDCAAKFVRFALARGGGAVGRDQRLRHRNFVKKYHMKRQQKSICTVRSPRVTGPQCRSINFPTQREIDPGADWIEDKGLGKAAVAWKIGRSPSVSSAKRGFRCALNILHFHAEMVNSFSAIARRQNGEIDMAIGNVDRLAMLARFAAAGNFLESERGFVEFRKLFSILGQQRDMSDPCHGSSPLRLGFYYSTLIVVLSTEGRNSFLLPESSRNSLWLPAA